MKPWLPTCLLDLSQPSFKRFPGSLHFAHIWMAMVHVSLTSAQLLHAIGSSKTIFRGRRSQMIWNRPKTLIDCWLFSFRVTEPPSSRSRGVIISDCDLIVQDINASFTFSYHSLITTKHFQYLSIPEKYRSSNTVSLSQICIQTRVITLV